MNYKNYYEYAKEEFNAETCEYCRKFSRCPEDTTNCEYCEVKIIQELVKIIDEYKKCDGFLLAHGWWGGLPPVQYEVTYAADGSIQLKHPLEEKNDEVQTNN